MNNERIRAECLVCTMPKNVECETCGVALLAFESMGPTPVGRDECPECGADEFEFVE